MTVHVSAMRRLLLLRIAVLLRSVAHREDRCP